MIGRAANVPQQKFSIGVVAAAVRNDYSMRVACATGVVFPSQDATYNSGGATPWSPSNTWSRGDLITNATCLYSCLGPSSPGFTGIGAASGPTGLGSAIREGGVYWMYAGTGTTGAISNDAIINGLEQCDGTVFPPVAGNQMYSSSAAPL